jgi:hypothetical protein
LKKVIAMYLPQYHEIKENNEWHGKGHTEWVACKKAIPLFKKHNQPRVPLENNYYNLLDENAQVEQAKLAKMYNIYGFCYYHYWFEGKQLLEKPMENMLKNPDIDLPFCVSWANHTWSSGPSINKRKTLIKQTYGDKEDWTAHFNYLLPFFKDDRYIKVNGKPMVVIYDVKDISCWKEMKNVWEELARRAGFEGLFYVNTLKHEVDVEYSNIYNFDAQFEYQPTFSLGKSKKLDYAKYYNIKRILCKDFLGIPCKCNYDRVWNRIFKKTPSNGIQTYLGCYNDWDTTARWGKNGIVHVGATPEKFKKHFQKQVDRSNQNKTDYIFITAWNEWSEGAYLEPDEKNKYAYLEAIKQCLSE